MGDAPIATAQERREPLPISDGRDSLRAKLLTLANEHPCSRHPLFAYLEECQLTNMQAAALLRNYDAHASVLRRYLLNAAAMMPEYAVPFVLENVRNEYGNGDYSGNHQDQLRDLAWTCGITRQTYFSCKIQAGISEFLKNAAKYYSPKNTIELKGMRKAGIIAGAITATEILAIKEFACIRKPFARRGFGNHIWFHHVEIEAEHTDDSLNLALCFSNTDAGVKGVVHGLEGVLKSNMHLYDGLLSAMQET